MYFRPIGCKNKCIHKGRISENTDDPQRISTLQDKSFNSVTLKLEEYHSDDSIPSIMICSMNSAYSYSI